MAQRPMPLDRAPATHQLAPIRSQTGPTAELLHELVDHLRQHRTPLGEGWAQNITEARLLTAMAKEDSFHEAASEYQNYVTSRPNGPCRPLQPQSRNHRHTRL